jgi:hypothetical protein
LVSAGPIVELGAGNGYWARLIRDRGGDVIAFDRRARDHLWSKVLVDDETALDAQVDRTLLVVMPYRPSGFANILRAWSGRQFAVVTRAEFPFTTDERNPEAFSQEALAIEDGGWSRQCERDLPHFGHIRVLLSLWGS